MKRWKICAIIGLAMACATLLLAGCQSQEYTPPSKDQSVSASALGNPGTLRVGVNASSVPLAGQTSSSSKIVGIDVDAASYLADQMGLKVEIIDVGNDPAQALADNKVDVVLGVDSSEEDAGYWKSSPYLQTGVALFGTSAETAVPTTDSAPKVAAQASSKSSWRVTNLFGDDALVVQEDLKSAFDAMDKGTARYAAADAVIGTFVAYTNSYDAKIIALLQDPSGFCVAVTSSNTELQSAVSAAVEKLVNGGMMNIIESKWFGSTLSLSDVTVVKAASDSKDKKSNSKKSEDAKSEKSEEKSAESADSEKSAEAASAEAAPAEGEANAEQQPAEEQPAEAQPAEGEA